VPDTLGRAGAVQISGNRSFYARTVGVVNLKKIVGFLVIALVVFYIFTQPDSAAGSLESIGTTLRNGAESVIRFFNQLVQ
jgi:hypothetical protein